jgi:hypothetical protein
MSSINRLAKTTTTTTNKQQQKIVCLQIKNYIIYGNQKIKKY